MIILDNECTLGTKIVYSKDKFEVKAGSDITGKIDGIGGITDTGDLLGIYVQNEKVYFLYNEKCTMIDSESFKVENRYINSKERLFKVSKNTVILCEIKYCPYVDPGMIIYDSEEEEYDFLLRFYKMFKDKRAFDNCINYIKNV